jgi:hypothetical protein
LEISSASREILLIDNCAQLVHILRESNFQWSSIMKIKIESEKIIKAVKKMEDIEIVLESPEDAKEAINLLLENKKLFEEDEQGKLKDIKVTSMEHYETSAVDYKLIFLLEFLFEAGVPLDSKVALIKQFQDFFKKM